jgi:DNA-binding NtrC family response regulator
MAAHRHPPLIWIADDEPLIRGNLSKLLVSEGYRVREAVDGLAAEQAFADPDAALLLLDLKMPGQGGLELLRKQHDQLEELPVIVITALGGSAAAIEAMKLGAFDYITKPFELDEVLLTVRRALKQRSLVAQVEQLTARSNATGDLAGDLADDEMVGRSPAMLDVFKTIGKVAMTDEPVLILGESGTGKELVAAAIHRNSRRAAGTFVRVNCAALSPTLLESELFGHERGAFTGAIARRIGRFEQASGGSLFLDEVGDLDCELQAKLLRVLQFGQFERVGSNDAVYSDVRVIAATNHHLAQRVADEQFREDLLYRLNVLTITLPPLRERPEDIPLLADCILRRLAAKYDWPHLQLSPEVARQLVSLPWPGNVRQLQNALARAAILARGRAIFPEHLELLDAVPAQNVGASLQPGMSLRDILSQIERRLIEEALAQTGWNRSKAATLLGISRRVLFDKIQQYGLSR